MHCGRLRLYYVSRKKKDNLMLIFQFGTVLYKCLLFWNILRWNLIEPFLMRGLHACMLFECCSCDRLRGNMVTGPREKIDMNLRATALYKMFFFIIAKHSTTQTPINTRTLTTINTYSISR